MSTANRIVRPDRDTPSLERLPTAAFARLIHVDPAYPQSGSLRIKVTGAFAIAETATTQLVGAESQTIRPVLRFSDGRCFASGEGPYRIASNVQFEPVACQAHEARGAGSVPPRSERPLRFVGSSWGFEAWADDRDCATAVTAPLMSGLDRLFTLNMPTLAIAAIVSPDAPEAGMTLVGRLEGRPVLVMMSIGY